MSLAHHALVALVLTTGLAAAPAFADQPPGFVFDGKLYLNYDKSVQKTWKKDIPGYIATADKK